MTAVQLLVATCMTQGMRIADIITEAECSGHTREEAIQAVQANTRTK